MVIHQSIGEPAEHQSRAGVESIAHELGVKQPASVYQDLLRSGLLVQLLPTESALRNFAEGFRVAPLAIGLGNSPEALGDIQIGVPGDPRAILRYEAYRVWAAAGQYPSLCKACQRVSESTGVDGLSTDPDFLLKAFFEALPALVSVNCVHIDRRQ